MTSNFHPIILAGGSGTRLWPLSRQNFPKQFLTLNGDFSLLQQTVQRAISLDSKQVRNQILIVSNDAHYFLCQEQLQNIEAEITYLLEPCVRNTAPAIACAAHYLANTVGKEAVMLIFPSDHWITPTKEWKKAMLLGAKYAQDYKKIVTFGIKPDSPKTAYGYIEAGDLLTTTIREVVSFKEKPTAQHAAKFVAQENFFWNSGIFMCTAEVFLAQLQIFNSDIYNHSQQALELSHKQHDFYRLHIESFALCKELSIDYAIMEHTKQAVVLPLSIQWSDLGCWSAVADANSAANSADNNGNIISGNVIAKDSHNCLINSENALVTTLGINNQIIVATNDAILIADKSYSQQVKELVHFVKQNYKQLTEDHKKVFRPWGYYEILVEGPTFKVKRLMLKPNAKLSLQLHKHRTEHWIIVSGEAEVTNGDKIFNLFINQSTYIPQNTRHRLSNIGNLPLYVIEVQSGAYLEEDDIVRFDDIYARNIEPVKA